MHSLAPLLLLLVTLCAVPVQAIEMYRWVDERGRTNISDSVPERYRDRAVKVDSTQYEPTKRQRAEAEALSAAQRARAASPPTTVVVPSAAERAGERGFSPRPSASSAAPAPSDCEALLRQYAQAQSCFAPCQQGNGSVKAGCFARCPNVTDPSPRCGLPKLQ